MDFNNQDIAYTIDTTEYQLSIKVIDESSIIYDYENEKTRNKLQLNFTTNTGLIIKNQDTINLHLIDKREFTFRGDGGIVNSGDTDPSFR